MSDSREAQLLAQLQKKDEQIARLEQENVLLRDKLDKLLRRLFGAQSEKLDPQQLLLLLAGGTEGPAQGKESGPAVPEADPPRSEKASRSERRARAPRVPEHLPLIEEILDPEPVKADPSQWRCIGEEVSEQLDFEPQRFFRRRLVRRKYVARAALDAVPLIAPLPGKLLERGIAGAGLLAHIVVSKYCDHLPLYRQEAIYATRYGVDLPRQTLARWVGLAAEWLSPIAAQIGAEILAASYMQMDETPIRYLAPGNGKTKIGYLWTCGQPGGDVVYRWDTRRAAAVLEEMIPAGATLVLQCDGYSAYGSFAESRGAAITLAGCLAHARRYFFEAKEQAPQIAGFILRQMQALYRIEAELRRTRAGPGLRQAIRAARSRPIMVRLQRLAVRMQSKGRFLPASLMGQALTYFLNHWERLRVYLTHGHVEIDNNLVENAIRPTALGKKNWLFIGEAEAGERSAIIYTVLESCRRRGIDPYAYLRDVLERLPSMTNRQIKDITPKAWAATQRAAERAAQRAAA